MALRLLRWIFLINLTHSLVVLLMKVIKIFTPNSYYHVTVPICFVSFILLVSDVSCVSQWINLYRAALLFIQRYLFVYSIHLDHSVAYYWKRSIEKYVYSIWPQNILRILYSKNGVIVYWTDSYLQTYNGIMTYAGLTNFSPKT